MASCLLLSFGGSGDAAGVLHSVRACQAGQDYSGKQGIQTGNCVHVKGCVYENFYSQQEQGQEQRQRQLRGLEGRGGGTGEEEERTKQEEDAAWARQRAYTSLGACATLVEDNSHMRTASTPADDKRAHAFANEVHEMLLSPREGGRGVDMRNRQEHAEGENGTGSAYRLNQNSESCVWELLMLTFLEDYGGASPAWNLAGFYGRHASALCAERVRRTAALLRSAAAGAVDEQEDYWFTVAACAATGDAGGVGVLLLRQHPALLRSVDTGNVVRATTTVGRVVETLIQLFSDRPTIADVASVAELADESARWQTEAIAVFEELQRAAGMRGDDTDAPPGENYALLEGPLLVAGALMSGDKIIEMVCENWFELFVAMLVSRHPAAHAGHGKEIVALLRRCIQRKPPTDENEAWWAELVQQSFEKKTAVVMQLLGARASPWLMAFAAALFAQCSPSVSATVARRVQALGNATIREVFMVQYLLTLTSIANGDDEVPYRQNLQNTAVRSLLTLCPTLGPSTAAQVLRHAPLCVDSKSLTLVDESHVMTMLHQCSLIDKVVNRGIGRGAALRRLIALKYGTMKFAMGNTDGAGGLGGLLFLIEARNRARVQQALKAMLPFSSALAGGASDVNRLDAVASCANLDVLVQRRCDAVNALRTLRGNVAHDATASGVAGSVQSSTDSDRRRALDRVRDALLRGDIGVEEAPEIAISLISIFDGMVASSASSSAAGTSQMPLTRGDAAIFADAIERRWSICGGNQISPSSNMFSTSTAYDSPDFGGAEEERRRAVLAAANLALARGLAGSLC